MSVDQLIADALRLPRDARARVAEELLSSLEETDECVAAAWAGELERRPANGFSITKSAIVCPR